MDIPEPVWASVVALLAAATGWLVKSQRQQKKNGSHTFTLADQKFIDERVTHKLNGSEELMRAIWNIEQLQHKVRELENRWPSKK